MLQIANQLRKTTGIKVEIVNRQAFSSPMLQHLYRLSNSILKEDEGHFLVHAQTNEEVHLFSEDLPGKEGRLLGFQFWRSVSPYSNSTSKVILGGKLRLSHEIRGKGLHLFSGLQYYTKKQLEEPHTTFYRLALVSLFGFVSFSQAVPYSWILDRNKLREQEVSEDKRIIYSALDSFLSDNHFETVPGTPLVNVKIFLSPETINSYPPLYYEKPAAKLYTKLNPDFATNGCFLSLGWKWTPSNILSYQQVMENKVQKNLLDQHI